MLMALVCENSQGRHKGWNEEQVYETSKVEAMDNTNNQKHEVLIN